MIRNVFPAPDHVFPDFQSVFPDFQSELSAQKTFSLREKGKSLATLQRPRNMLMVNDVTAASARNLLPHLPRFFRPGPARFPRSASMSDATFHTPAIKPSPGLWQVLQENRRLLPP